MASMDALPQHRGPHCRTCHCRTLQPRSFANSPMQYSEASSLYCNITLIGVSGVRAESSCDYCRSLRKVSNGGLPVISMRRLARSRTHFCVLANSSPFVGIISSGIRRFVLLMSASSHICDSLSSRSLKLTCS